MIDKSLDFAYHPLHYAKNANTSETVGLPGLGKGFHMVDVGCGVGGSSRYIVGKYAPLTAKATGVSLSPFQVNKANDLSRKVGLGSQLQYQVGDAMKMPFSDNSFDLGMISTVDFVVYIINCSFVYSLEYGEWRAHAGERSFRE
jgi:ubiquinone/menaquinone biosynthesis C-methylase UbiE